MRDNNVMVSGDYSAANSALEAQHQQRLELIRKEQQPLEAEALQQLLDMEAAGNPKRQEHLESFRQQREDGTLPDHLEAVFQANEQQTSNEEIEAATTPKAD